jgi:hypothetical protein
MADSEEQNPSRPTETLPRDSTVSNLVSFTAAPPVASPGASPAVAGNIWDHPDVKVEAKSRETPAEEAARLKTEGREALYKLCKDGALTGVGVLLILAIVTACFVIIFTSTSEPKVRDSAMSIILLVVGGFVGFVTGKLSAGSK